MRILDRYLLRQFVVTFVFATGALLSIFIVIDLFERLDKFIDNKLSASVLVQFYAALVPSYLELLIPIALLLAGLFSVGRLSNNNEITAIRSSGRSTFRLLLPILAFALIMSGAQVYFNGWIAPAAATARFDLERRYLGSDAGRGSLSDLSFRETPTLNVLLQHYDETRKKASGVSIEEYGSAMQPRMVWKVVADSMLWVDSVAGWVVPVGVRWTFGTDSIQMERIEQWQAPFTVRHHQIVKLQLNPDEMTFPELDDYIKTLKRGGRDTRVREIDLAGQWAFPFVNLIVVLISVPFASIKRRGGLATNIAAAMVLAITYIAFTKISQAMGAASNLPVEVVAWSANAIFFIVGLVVLRRAR